MDGVPFTRREAQAAGLDRLSLESMIATGAVHRVFRGMYLDGLLRDDLRARVLAVSRILPPGAAVSRRTAAWLRGVDARAPAELDADGPADLECTVDVEVEPLRRPGLRCFVAPLTGDVEEYLGVPITSAVRTTIDLLRWSPPHLALGAADALAHAGWVTPEAVQADLERWEGRRGVVQARRLAGLMEPATESFGESWLRLRVVDAGFPRPRVQIPVLVAGKSYRLDLGWEDVWAAAEYDGQEHHSSPEQIRHDEARRASLERAGWRILVAGRGEVLGSGLRLERAIGELLGQEPRIYRRAW